MFIGILQISIFAQAEDAVLHNGKMRSPPFPGAILPYYLLKPRRALFQFIVKNLEVPCKPVIPRLVVCIGSH